MGQQPQPRPRFQIYQSSLGKFCISRGLGPYPQRCAFWRSKADHREPAWLMLTLYVLSDVTPELGPGPSYADSFPDSGLWGEGEETRLEPVNVDEAIPD